MDSIRQELDRLMGIERNVPLQDRKKQKEHYDDPDICKHYVLSVCPHDLFPNTKYDLGVCHKRHDEIYKKMYLEDENRHVFEKKYINETINLIESLLHGVDSKIKKAQSKLDQGQITTDQPKELQEKLDAIDEEIKKLLAQVETFGEEGKIEESEACMSQIEALKKRKEEIKLTGDPSLGANSRQMKVCEICGGLQALSDIEKRSQTHLEGRLHTGFATLRRELDMLKKKREELRNSDLISKKEKEKDRDRERERDRERDRETDRHRRDDDRSDRHRSRRKDSSEGRSRKRRDKGRSASRSRSHRRSRSPRKHRSHRDKRDRRRDRSSSKSESRSPSSPRNKKHKKSSRRDKSREKSSENGQTKQEGTR